MKIVSLVFLLLMFHLVNAQTVTLQGAIDRINTVKDYKADVQVKAAIPFIKIPITKAKVYFKAKNKFKVVSDNIVILPKQGMSDLNEFLVNPKRYTQVPGEYKMLNGLKTQLITLLPSDENSEIILAKVYLSAKEPLIYRTVLTTKSSGTVTIDYEYAESKAFGLPSKMTFYIDVRKFKMPKSVAANIRSTEKQRKTEENQKGSIVIYFSNYQVNKGISDSFFKED
jgi:outer membrane lipoprotein-sorting protein